MRTTTNAASKLASNLLLAGLVACSSAAPPRSAESPALGRTVSFELPSDSGALVPIPQPKAKLTVIDAFAPTCKPCAKKVPELLAQRSALEAVGARLVFVAVLSDGESTDDARSALRSWRAEAPFLVDRGDVLRRELGVTELPASVIVDVSGRIDWVAPANASADDVVAAARASAGGT